MPEYLRTIAEQTKQQVLMAQEIKGIVSRSIPTLLGDAMGLVALVFGFLVALHAPGFF